jgi:hypothetical protein
VLEDLDWAEQVERLAVGNCQHQDVAGAWHAHIFSRIPPGAKAQYPTIPATIRFGRIRGLYDLGANSVGGQDGSRIHPELDRDPSWRRPEKGPSHV